MAAIKALGLDHVVLRVADAGRAGGWYQAVLNCRVERVLPSIGLTQLRAGSSLIDLIAVGEGAEEVEAALGARRRNMDHFCVQLAEFDEEKIVDHLNWIGVEPGVVVSRYGALGHGPSMYLVDPDGNTVELKGPPDSDQTEGVPDAIRP